MSESDIKDALDPDEVYSAIREGVRDAMWMMINNATNSPCADFYQSIQDGVKQAMLELGPSKDTDQGG